MNELPEHLPDRGGVRVDTPDPQFQGGAFPTTRWSEVARAADIDPAVRRAALGRLIERYAPAFRMHLTRRRGLSPSDADDAFQGFVCDQVVAGGIVGAAVRARGKLRSYLLGAIDHYVYASWRQVRAKKRSPDSPLSDLAAAEAVPASAHDADVFDLEWARQVLLEATTRMREECERGPHSGHRQIWQLFLQRVLNPILTGVDSPGYADLVRAIGFESPTQASNALVTGKRMMARKLRTVIADYAADPGEVESEMADLWRIVASAGRAGGLESMLGASDRQIV